MTTTNDTAISELAKALGIDRLEKSLDELKSLVTQAPKTPAKPTTQAERLTALENQVDELRLKVELFGENAPDALKNALAQQARALKDEVTAMVVDVKNDIAELKQGLNAVNMRVDSGFAEIKTILEEAANTATIHGNGIAELRTTTASHESRIKALEDQQNPKFPLWTLGVGAIAGFLVFLWAWFSDFSQKLTIGDGTYTVHSTMDRFWIVAFLGIAVAFIVAGVCYAIATHSKPKAKDGSPSEVPVKTDENNKAKDPVPA